MPTASVQRSPLRAFINEIHYENAGTDAGEGIEVAGLAGTDLTGWSLVLHNGNGGASYWTTALSGLIPDQDDGFGTLAFSYPVDGIRNGSPDGVALVDETGAVVQFLSHEGSFTTVGGPANGLTSTDIGVVETATTPVGFSLQLTAQGAGAASFNWAPAPADDSFGAVNAGQDFTAGGTGPGSFSVADASVGKGNAKTSELVITVTRSAGSTGTASVAYTVQAGTATADDVAGLPSGTLTFADGETSQTVVVQVQGDGADEPDETVTLELSGATGGATIADGSATGTITNDDRALVSISDIQGAGQRSALLSQEVATSGIVTAVDSNGFYLRDPAGDGNTATSDAMFVFTGSKPLVARGDAVVVTGTVDEFTPGGDSTDKLSTTQIRAPQIQVVSSGNALPQAVLIGPHGRTPPTEIIDDDGLASYAPATDGIGFFESLEGMLVTVQDPVAVAPTTSFEEIYTVASDGGTDVVATNLSERGTVKIEGGEGGLGVTNQVAGSDLNPERIQIQADPDFTPGGTAGVPVVDTGVRLADVTGVASYGFGNFKVLATERITAAQESALERETTTVAGTEDRLLVASYNVLNSIPTTRTAARTWPRASSRPSLATSR